MENILDTLKEKKPFVFSESFTDLKEGLLSFRVFGRFAWQDIKLRYKRSTLGPFWITLSTMIMIYCMGVIYANLLNIDLTTFFPYLASGMVIWQFFLTLTLEGLDCFVEGGPMIKQVSLPFSFYVYRVVYRNLLVLAHQVVGLIPIFFYFNVSVNAPLFLIGTFLFMLILVFSTLLLALLGSRYRDVKPIISSFLGVVFFVTPIIWMPGMLSGRKLLLIKYNPIHHMINLVRNPLLGQEIPLSSWVCCLLILMVLVTFSLYLFGKYRRRIAFWV